MTIVTVSSVCFIQCITGNGFVMKCGHFVGEIVDSLFTFRVLSVSLHFPTTPKKKKTWDDCCFQSFTYWEILLEPFSPLRKVWILTTNVFLYKSWMETLEEVMYKKKKGPQMVADCQASLYSWFRRGSLFLRPWHKNLMLSALKKLMQLLLNTSGDYGKCTNVSFH